MISAAPKGWDCGGKKRNPAQRRRSGWVSGTSTITILNPSGSRICISLNPHGLSVGSSIITQVAPYPDKQYPPDSKATQPLEPGGRIGRYHNHHLLPVRGVLEGHRSSRRSPSAS